MHACMHAHRHTPEIGSYSSDLLPIERGSSRRVPERTPANEKVTKNKEQKDQNVTKNRECSKSLLCDREKEQ